MPYRVLHIAKSVAAQMFAPIPAGHDDYVITQILSFEHPQNDDAGSAFAVVILGAARISQQRPRVVCCFGKFLAAAEFLNEGSGRRYIDARPPGHCVFRPTVIDDVFQHAHFRLVALPLRRFKCAVFACAWFAWAKC